jgi:hypothetical protein
LLNEGTEEMPMTAQDYEETFCHPGDLPTKTWARVQAINASHLARLNGGCSRDEAICQAVQACYDVLIEDDLHRGGNLTEHGLEIACPRRVLALAVELNWLTSAVLNDAEVERRFRDWLWKVIEPRAEYWRAYCNAQPFGIELSRPAVVIRSVPNTPGARELPAYHEQTLIESFGRLAVQQFQSLLPKREAVDRDTLLNLSDRCLRDCMKIYEAQMGMSVKMGKVEPERCPACRSVVAQYSDIGKCYVCGWSGENAAYTGEGAVVQPPRGIILSCPPGALQKAVIARMWEALSDERNRAIQRSASKLESTEGRASEPKSEHSLDAVLKAADRRTEDPKLKKKLIAVLRYKHYLGELQALKTACKRYQTPALLKKQFPRFAVWDVLDNDDEKDIAVGHFTSGCFAWALAKRLNSLTGTDKNNRTLKNYRKALRTAGISV